MRLTADRLPDAPQAQRPAVTVRVAPGICGFDCVIEAQPVDKRTVRLKISGSECGQVKRLSGELDRMSLKELFMPLTRNPVYTAAEKSACHPSCAVPMAVLKAVEAAMGMALPSDVRIHFEAAEGADREK
jgi:hypothetical protein